MNSSSSSKKQPARQAPEYEEGEIPSEGDDPGLQGEQMQTTPARFDLDGKSKLFSVSARCLTFVT